MKSIAFLVILYSFLCFSKERNDPKELKDFEFYPFSLEGKESKFYLGVIEEEKALLYRGRKFLVLDINGKEVLTTVKRIDKIECRTDSAKDYFDGYLDTDKYGTFFVYDVVVDKSIKDGLLFYPESKRGFVLKKENKLSMVNGRTLEFMKKVSSDGKWKILANKNKRTLYKNDKEYKVLKKDEGRVEKIYQIFSHGESDYLFYSCYFCNKSSPVQSTGSQITLSQLGPKHAKKRIKSTFLKKMPHRLFFCYEKEAQEIWPEYKFKPKPIPPHLQKPDKNYKPKKKKPHPYKNYNSV